MGRGPRRGWGPQGTSPHQGQLREVCASHASKGPFSLPGFRDLSPGRFLPSQRSPFLPRPHSDHPMTLTEGGTDGGSLAFWGRGDKCMGFTGQGVGVTIGLEPIPGRPGVISVQREIAEVHVGKPGGNDPPLRPTLGSASLWLPRCHQPRPTWAWLAAIRAGKMPVEATAAASPASRLSLLDRRRRIWARVPEKERAPAAPRPRTARSRSSAPPAAQRLPDENSA